MKTGIPVEQMTEAGMLAEIEQLEVLVKAREATLRQAERYQELVRAQKRINSIRKGTAL